MDTSKSTAQPALTPSTPIVMPLVTHYNEDNLIYEQQKTQLAKQNKIPVGNLSWIRD